MDRIDTDLKVTQIGPFLTEIGPAFELSHHSHPLDRMARFVTGFGRAPGQVAGVSVVGISVFQ